MPHTPLKAVDPDEAGWSWRHQIDRLLETLDAFG
jgi:hypothetical protein